MSPLALAGLGHLLRCAKGEEGFKLEQEWLRSKQTSGSTAGAHGNQRAKADCPHISCATGVVTSRPRRATRATQTSVADMPAPAGAPSAAPADRQLWRKEAVDASQAEPCSNKKHAEAPSAASPRGTAAASVVAATTPAAPPSGKQPPQMNGAEDRSDDPCTVGDPSDAQRPRLESEAKGEEAPPQGILNISTAEAPSAAPPRGMAAAAPPHGMAAEMVLGQHADSCLTASQIAAFAARLHAGHDARAALAAVLRAGSLKGRKWPQQSSSLQ